MVIYIYACTYIEPDTGTTTHMVHALGKSLLRKAHEGIKFMESHNCLYNPITYTVHENYWKRCREGKWWANKEGNFEPNLAKCQAQIEKGHSKHVIPCAKSVKKEYTVFKEQNLHGWWIHSVWERRMHEASGKTGKSQTETIWMLYSKVWLNLKNPKDR